MVWRLQRPIPLFLAQAQPQRLEHNGERGHCGVRGGAKIALGATQGGANGVPAPAGAHHHGDGQPELASHFGEPFLCWVLQTLATPFSFSY